MTDDPHRPKDGKAPGTRFCFRCRLDRSPEGGTMAQTRNVAGPAMRWQCARCTAARAKVSQRSQG